MTEYVVKIAFWLRAFDSVTIEATSDAEAVEKAKVAVPFAPLPVRGGIGVYMVCGRSGGAQEINRAAVENALIDQKFQNASVRYLSELRRTAFIDLRN